MHEIAHVQYLQHDHFTKSNEQHLLSRTDSILFDCKNGGLAFYINMWLVNNEVHIAIDVLFNPLAAHNCRGKISYWIPLVPPCSLLNVSKKAAL